MILSQGLYRSCQGIKKVRVRLDNFMRWKNGANPVTFAGPIYHPLNIDMPLYLLRSVYK